MSHRNIRAQRKEADQRKHFSMEPEPEDSDEAPMVLIDGSPVDLREGWPTLEDLNTKA